METSRTEIHAPERPGWFRRNWLAMAGVFSMFWPALIKFMRFILEAIGLGGSIDFLLARSENPGWLSSVLEFVLNPPEVVRLVSLILGVYLILRSERRRNDGRFLGRDYSPPVFDAQAFQEKVREQNERIVEAKVKRAVEGKLASYKTEWQDHLRIVLNGPTQAISSLRAEMTVKLVTAHSTAASLNQALADYRNRTEPRLKAADEAAKAVVIMSELETARTLKSQIAFIKGALAETDYDDLTSKAQSVADGSYFMPGVGIQWRDVCGAFEDKMCKIGVEAEALGLGSRSIADHVSFSVNPDAALTAEPNLPKDRDVLYDFRRCVSRATNIRTKLERQQSNLEAKYAIIRDRLIATFEFPQPKDIEPKTLL